MKILHILNDGHDTLPDAIINEQSKENEVQVIDLSKNDTPYERIVDAIFSSDRVISW